MLAVGVVRKVLVRENCKRQAEEIRVTEKKKKKKTAAVKCGIVAFLEI